MKSRVNVNYLEMPLSVFASKYPSVYFDLVSRKIISTDALFDNRYIVRIKLGGSGAIEVGWASDDWQIQ